MTEYSPSSVSRWYCRGRTLAIAAIAGLSLSACSTVSGWMDSDASPKTDDSFTKEAEAVIASAQPSKPSSDDEAKPSTKKSKAKKSRSRKRSDWRSRRAQKRKARASRKSRKAETVREASAKRTGPTVKHVPKLVVPATLGTFASQHSTDTLLLQGIRIGTDETSLKALEAVRKRLADGRPKEVLTALSIWETEERLTAPGYLLTAILLTETGQDQSAFTYLHKAVDLDPHFWQAWDVMGQWYERADRLEEAQTMYLRALSIDPQLAPTINNLGIVFLKQGYNAEALEQFERALVLDPSMSVVRGNIVLANAKLGRYAQAMRSVSYAERPHALNNVGFIAMQNGDYDVAEKYFQTALEESPTYFAVAAENLDLLKGLRTE